MLEIVRLSRAGVGPTGTIEDAARCYRVGIVDNPWGKPYLRERLATAPERIGRRVRGQDQAIRRALDDAGFTHTPIMAYSTKFASALYGPFREAGGSALKGDRKSYQMNPMNRREAIRESLLDEQEGADALMVKPAGAYLDIIRDIREASRLPVAAYQVSGEYAMIKFGAQAGAIDEDRVVRETLGSIKRAGADLIFTYFAMDLALAGI